MMISFDLNAKHPHGVRSIGWGAWRGLMLVLLAGVLAACGGHATPVPVSQAQAVSKSKAAEQAKEFAPQAFGAAEKLRAESEYLHTEGRLSEAEAAGAQALVAYNEAFALAQLSIAQERLENAQKNEATATRELSHLDGLQTLIAKDAETFETQARVTLDTETVKDAEKISPARAEARRLAAKQLTAEAALLCLGARLLKAESTTLDSASAEVGTLERELTTGSMKQDLYPRSSDLRATCLKELTMARRRTVEKEPQSAESDMLLTALSSAGKYMVYRDDRGVVVNVGQPLSSNAPDAALSKAAKEALGFVGGTSKKHASFPLLVVVHTRKSGEDKRAERMGQLAQEALLAAGAPAVHVKSVGSAQPVVQASMPSAVEKNERIELIFVAPGR